MYHNFCIHSSVDRHLGCFHVLAIVKSAATNTGVQASLAVWFSQVTCVAVGLLGYTVLMDLFAGQQWQHRHKEQACGHSGGRGGWDELRE